ncbi:MAG: hypothetical protein V3V01_13905 [Acidimicrobiales bacterium]
MAPPSDLTIELLLTQQFGLVTRSQARESGFSNGQIQRRLDSGIWLRSDRGVFRHHLFSRCWNTQVLAPILSTGGLASHQSAAHLWHLDGFRQVRPDITVPAHCGLRRRGIQVHESTTFDMCNSKSIDGIPTTGIYRTLLDLAAVVSMVKLRQAVDDARLRNLIEWDGLHRSFMEHARRGRNGTVLMRRFLEDHLEEANIPKSTWSRLVADLLVAEGLSEPVLEHEVNGPGFTYFLDLAYPDNMLGLELDSVTWHLNRKSFEQDPRRRNDLENLGWSMRNFTWSDWATNPIKLADTVRKAFEITRPKRFRKLLLK